MNAEKMEVTINKIGKTELPEALQDTVLVPMPESEKEITALFKAWPKTKGLMKEVSLVDAVQAGLRSLARAAKQKELIADYRVKNPAGRRGRSAEKEIVTI